MQARGTEKPGRRILSASETLTEADNTHMRWLVAAALWNCQNLVWCFASSVLIARQRAPSLGAHHRV